MPIAPGGESWSAFVDARLGRRARAWCAQHPGELVVAAVHAGVIEATMISFLGVAPEVYRRGWVRITHASMTEWEWVPVGGPLGPPALQRRVRGAAAADEAAGQALAEEGTGQPRWRTGQPGVLHRLAQRLLGHGRSCTSTAA